VIARCIAGGVGGENMRTPEPPFWRDWLALAAALVVIAGILLAAWALRKVW